MGRSPLMLSGAILALIGLITFAIPIFTTQQTRDVARIGDVKIQATENTSHVVPPILSGGALLLGILLLGAGLLQKR